MYNVVDYGLCVSVQQFKKKNTNIKARVVDWTIPVAGKSSFKIPELPECV